MSDAYDRGRWGRGDRPSSNNRKDLEDYERGKSDKKDADAHSAMIAAHYERSAEEFGRTIEQIGERDPIPIRTYFSPFIIFSPILLDFYLLNRIAVNHGFGDWWKVSIMCIVHYIIFIKRFWYSAIVSTAIFTILAFLYIGDDIYIPYEHRHYAMYALLYVFLWKCGLLHYLAAKASGESIVTAKYGYCVIIGLAILGTLIIYAAS